MPGRLLLAFISAAITCNAAEERVLPGTVSPNKEIAILETSAANGQRDYYFARQASRQRLGFVLPRDQRHQISNVAIVVSWNKSSTKVASLVYYGTKLSELLLHSRASDGTFKEVNFSWPDPVELYRNRTGKAIPQPGDGYSENAVGPWLDDNTVMLLSGEAKQIIHYESGTEEVSLDEYTHVFVSFRARIRRGSTTLSDLKLIGPLTNALSEDFRKRWGDRYF